MRYWRTCKECSRHAPRGGRHAERDGYTLRSFLALVALAAVLAGCSRPRAPERVKVGRAAPEISGEDLNGQVFRLSDYRGKVVLLSFWANW